MPDAPNQAACLPHVVRQHAEEAATLFVARSRAIKSAPVKMWQLQRVDERLAAHLDGLSVAGDQAWPFLDDVLQASTPGAVFVAATRAITCGNQEWLDRLFAAAVENPVAYREVVAAFGWLEPSQLQGTVAGLLRSDDPLRRAAGLATCAMHRVDPGLAAGPWMKDASPVVRARALRAAAEIGVPALASACLAALKDEDPECQFWGAWSAVLLGDRGRALAVLWQAAMAPGKRRQRAFRLSLQAMELPDAQRALRPLASDPQQLRRLIHGTGITGDVKYVPWLINHMRNDAVARVAGEAFSLMTGADIVAHRLHRVAPEQFDAGPNEDPADPDVAMDPDEGQAWPDPARVEMWWKVNGDRFPAGVRWFVGAQVTPERCVEVLKTGCQFHRMAAARCLSLLAPGTPLFNTNAPARRQQTLLTTMGAQA